jgi:GMP synthase-like glutamine amidotransferase
MRLAFVISEHRGGLGPEVVARYRQAVRRLSELARADVATSHYTDVGAFDADAIVLSGSFDPWSAHDPAALERLGGELRAYDGPVLGICAGMQTLVRAVGGTISAADQASEEGFAPIDVLDASSLLRGLEPRIEVFQHHTDEISELPTGFRVLAISETSAVEAVAAEDRPWWGTQFHPEEWSAEHPAGQVVLQNFLRLAGIEAR